MTQNWTGNSVPDEVVLDDHGSRKREIWSIATEQDVLEAFFRDVFTEHWQGIRFGPLIEGAAYEWKCPSAPQSISVRDGYLTIMFGNGGHFHLCIGDNRGTDKFPTPDDLRKRRKPSRAQLFRGFGGDGKPLSWGFEMWNGAGEPMISIFFPNPFLNDDDRLAEEPVFERLATWRAIARKWLNREPERLDQEGKGFRG